LLARSPLFSRFYGFLQKHSRSARKIAAFIRFYEIDQSEFLETQFRSFNDFFIRKLKKESRPLIADRRTLTMPADGRYFVYPEFEHFIVKGKDFSIRDFLQNDALAEIYSKGSMVIARLCPTDYHRFHFPCDGVPSKAQSIHGHLYSVNPLALKKRMAIFCENKRMITEFDTEDFGKVLYIEIGATSVGSIHQTYNPGQRVCKGEEKGYFEFGGSCLVLLFEKGRIQFDQDLIENTRNKLETRANFGDSLGRMV
jgi:phosphatidylserine decarboxylase